VKILITRPEPQATALAARLTQQRHQCDIWAAISFVPPKDLQSIHFFQQQLKDDDLVIVGSQEVIKHVPDIVTTLTTHKGPCFAIGKGTATALQKVGIKITGYPTPGGSDTLLALPAFQHITSKTVWLLRAQSGRELIPEVLLKRNTNIHTVCCYQRIDNHDVSTLPPQSPELLICTNVTSLENIITALSQRASAYLSGLPITVIGQKMLDLAISMRCQPIALQAVDNDSLVNCVEQLHDRQNTEH